MPTEIQFKPVDQSTIIAVCTFKDEDDDLLTPNADTVTWSLYNEQGQIVNEREDEAIASDNPVNIVISGNDIKYSDGARRILVVKARYNSTLGDNLPLVDMASFSIKNLLAGR
jgi:hypothetical protein